MRYEAAIKIQTAVRSYLLRRKKEKDRDSEATNEEVVRDSQTTETSKKIEAAVRIQAAVRGFLMRQKFKTDLALVNKEIRNVTSKVEFPNVTANAFDILLEYMYTGELRMTCQEFMDVKLASLLLRMDEAVNKCNKMLDVNSPNSRHMFYLYVGAIKFGYTTIIKTSIKFMGENFETIVMEKEFLDLEAEQIVEIFNSEEMSVRSEIVVFLSALKWLRYNFLEREQHIISVLSCVRFSLMSEEEILACYHPPVLPEVVKIPEIHMLLLNATCCIVSKSQGQEKYFSKLEPKLRKKKLDGGILELWDLSNFDPEKLAED